MASMQQQSATKTQELMYAQILCSVILGKHLKTWFYFTKLQGNAINSMCKVDGRKEGKKLPYDL